MNDKEFSEAALRTESIVDDKNYLPMGLLNVLCIFVECGSILDAYKRSIFYGSEIDFDAFNEKYTEIRERLDFIKSEDHWDSSDVDTRLLHGILGIATESAELVEIVFTDCKDDVNILEEIGDIEWYKAIIFDVLKSSNSEVRKKVINKLRTRYPDKFTSDAALNRDLETEREALEDEIEDSLQGC